MTNIYSFIEENSNAKKSSKPKTVIIEENTHIERFVRIGRIMMLLDVENASTM